MVEQRSDRHLVENVLSQPPSQDRLLTGMCGAEEPPPDSSESKKGSRKREKRPDGLLGVFDLVVGGRGVSFVSESWGDGCDRHRADGRTQKQEFTQGKQPRGIHRNCLTHLA